MTDQASSDEEMEQLRARTRELETKLSESEERGRTTLIQAELKSLAIQAGIIDLDGLKLIEIDGLRIAANGEIEGAAGLIASLRKRKPMVTVSSSTFILWLLVFSRQKVALG